MVNNFQMNASYSMGLLVSCHGIITTSTIRNKTKKIFQMGKD